MIKDYAQQALANGLPPEKIVPAVAMRYDELAEMVMKEKKRPVTPTCFKKLDDMLGGFENGRLYVLSAPPKNGKSTMVQTMMYNLSLAGFPSLFFSYEMSWQEVVRKFMEMDEEMKNTKAPTKLPMYVPMDMVKEAGDLQLTWMEEAIINTQKLNQETPLSLVAIDHLHFLLPLKDYKTSISFLIGGIVRELKKMSVKLNVPIMLVAHVGKIQDDRVPSYRDIRDSSFISQEADVVMIMWRKKNKDTAKKITDDNSTDEYSNKAFLSVELDRVRGRSGKIELWHTGTMFEEYDPQKHGYMQIEDKGVCTNVPTC